jgi:large subunit ribosomal protein L25
MLELHHNGRKETCLIQDLQYDYLGDEIVHVDLMRRSMSEEVSVNVAIESTGQEDCKALQESGAFLDQSLTDLEVVCRADAIPEQLTVDIGELGINETVLVRDVPMPAGVRTEHDPDDVVLTIHVSEAEPEEEEEPGEQEAAAAGEPEVLREREEEEGGG